MEGPKYVIKDFIEACKTTLKHKKNQVIVVRKAEEDAKRIFRMETKPDILKVIVNFKKKDLIYVNTTELRNTAKNPPPIVDAYHFIYRFESGYIAFYLSAYTNKWVIKSFHRKDKDSENEFERQFRELGLI